MLEVRRKSGIPSPDTAITGEVTTAHVDATYQDIVSGTLSSDNTSAQKTIWLNGKNSTSVIVLAFVLPFLVTRRTADTPDYTVIEGVSDWQNDEDEDIRPQIIADGDNGWKLQVKDQSGDIGDIDWTFRIETKQTFAL